MGWLQLLQYTTQAVHAAVSLGRKVSGALWGAFVSLSKKAVVHVRYNRHLSSAAVPGSTYPGEW